jgi:hypothetical protein
VIVPVQSSIHLLFVPPRTLMEVPLSSHELTDGTDGEGKGAEVGVSVGASVTFVGDRSRHPVITRE